MNIRISLLIISLTSIDCAVYAQTTTFSYTGVVQTYTVPACVFSITVDVKGGAGAVGAAGTTAGNGGRVQATISVTPAEVLNIYVGLGATSFSGGWNGGAAGGAAAGAGGDASDIQHRRTTGCDNGKCPQGKRCVRGWCVS